MNILYATAFYDLLSYYTINIQKSLIDEYALYGSNSGLEYIPDLMLSGTLGIEQRNPSRGPPM